MSGHNKWSTIKHKKGAKDAKRSKMFSKIIKEITVSVKESGPDPDANPKLRLAIANAKGVSMPKDNIERAINKGKDKDSSNFEEVTYEGYLSHGIAVYVECTTDNTQRTVSNIRSIFNKYDGSLGKNGSLSFLFDRKGIFLIPADNVTDKEEFELEMIDAGAEDIEEEEGFITVATSMEDFGNMQKKLEEMNIEAESQKLERIPHERVSLDKESAKKILKVIETFEDDDDVQNVYHNLEVTDEVMAEME
ncbi:MAG: YebC/PmpR family DNA-binding transcriptional regulator [Bacteroidales bacterium]|nr:YebC/PmpR family DNA-binding transcriptional regulator [Bacteroidales bacterium]MCF8344857.1 YebC/PmpR family DNA-binding transcriptional regulator [Bacteroidales bacterium]MCF8350817.1 YebC/PmpR family DNA-binding transcriptional regulator [Bacteroidales bacterium]MCF8374802.1 YebC/PmpR family DNA-binding transcriptional regulator [Bacteroidales bacterium]MCF8399794.1 YebC/PmpR family DNA-binding transcriptional regulator [Bacteroidales bacterium]